MITEKDTIRKEKRALRQNLVDRYEKSHQIFSRFFKLQEYKEAKKILFYVSYGSEVMTFDAINKALLDGKEVFIPYLLEKEMGITKINDLSDLKKTDYGALEPGQRKQNDKTILDIVVVPGVAFDKEKHRIGSGLGFYDRFLSNLEVTKIGVCFSEQLAEKVPQLKYDIPVDILVTENEVL